MKKLVFGLFLFCVLSFSLNIVKAEDYKNYQEIVFDNDEAFMLKDYSEDDYEDYYKDIKKKKFIGWKINVVHANENVEFVSETKLKISNNGYSSIKHNISLETKEETNYQISASGGIKLEVKGDIKKFKGKVDADIKASISYSKLTTNKEKYEFEIIVDPKTYVKILTRGTGEINNGVGKYFFFWINTKSGGWETFTVKTEYYEIVKDRI
ncbi:MAG TPA: CIA30 family protein [Bacillota bacterium]|nr:CIA30 family protein [Bacillota bacterium]